MTYKLRVAANGDIQSQYRTSEEEPVQGTMIDGMLCVDSDAALDMHINYWNGSEWATREPAPSEFCVWVDGAWVEDAGRTEAVRSQWLEKIRMDRNARLMMCDWTQMPDSQLSSDDRSLWATYRQSLRDLPAANTGILSIESVSWPTPPNA